LIINYFYSSQNVVCKADITGINIQYLTNFLKTHKHRDQPLEAGHFNWIVIIDVDFEL